ncbi:hypothetical protein BDV37DRAFT_277335 [Aspergillus pseudonomiae]|uniref:F-box domain-containing protein n=1 Tax=Aspergillus pseudonomiae TaxID=1506151 RepID=A0A5N7CRV9_9EURO|nr:uncharacterized protein BDV37DRAFT_277335 [Aspergillus pseudonomiae]KAE8396864.1 hypothetical protein BDV37DRAFT_277335 [Aspergillus pseudonomiae]
MRITPLVISECVLSDLHSLPVELLIIIVQLVHEESSLKPLSGVNRLFRQLCTPILFSKLRIACSTVGLDRLASASESSIRSREQDSIIRSARDLQVLRTSLPRFSRLHSILLCFINGLKSPFQPLSDRVLLDGQSFFADHVKTLATAVVAARRQGIVIDTLAISGYYPNHLSPDYHLSHLLDDAFADVEELRLEDSPALLEYFTRNPLQHLQRLEFGSYWMSVLKLERFVYAHKATLRYLHLEDIWYIHTEDPTSGIDLSIADTKKALESISHIRQWGILRELTINRQITGHCEIREVFDRT